MKRSVLAAVLLALTLSGCGYNQIQQKDEKTNQLQANTEAELMATVFPHPTLSEMMHESVLAAYGRTLHI